MLERLPRQQLYTAADRVQHGVAVRQHRCITHSSVGRTEYVLRRGKESVRVPVRSVLQSNETAVTRQATLDGAGIALLPTYFATSELARGKLVRLLPDYEPEPLGIHAVYLSRIHQPPLLRLMLDFLAERYSGEVAPWDRETPAVRTLSSKSHHRRSSVRK